MSFTYLTRCSASLEGSHFICDNFLDILLKFFFDDETKYYQKSNDLFSNMIKKPEREVILKKIFNEKTIDILKDKLKSGSTIIQSRILNFIASSCYQDYAFDFFSDLGFIDLTIEGINDTTDILMLIDTINRLSNLGTSKKGVDYIIKNLYNTLLDILNDEGSLSIVQSKVLDSLGLIASKSEYHIESMLKEPLLKIVYKFFEHPEDEMLISCINFFSHICETEKGLEEVLKTKNIVNQWVSFIYSSNIELRKITIALISRFMNCIPQMNDHISSLRQQFYNKIDESPTETLFKMMNSGYSVELKYSIYSLMKAISHYEWGIKSILNTKGFASYLLDRSTESFKLGHEWKYAIIQTMVSRPHSKSIIGFNYYYLFIEYIKQGIFYKKAESTVLVQDVSA